LGFFSPFVCVFFPGNVTSSLTVPSQTSSLNLSAKFRQHQAVIPRASSTHDSHLRTGSRHSLLQHARELFCSRPARSQLRHVSHTTWRTTQNRGSLDSFSVRQELSAAPVRCTRQEKDASRCLCFASVADAGCAVEPAEISIVLTCPLTARGFARHLPLAKRGSAPVTL